MRIYVSSTWDDLQDYRRAVYAQLRKLGHDAIGMEDYVASDQRPLARCLADVAASDVYVGIFALRYGYIPRKDNPRRRSITELEYRAAVAAKKECLVFLLDADAPWPATRMDSYTGEGDRGALIEGLRARLRERHVVSTFQNPDRLAADVGAAVYRVEAARTVMVTPPPTARVSADGEPKKRPRAPGVRARAGFPLLWRPGTTLRVRLLGGTAAQRRSVERFAPIWSAYANLRFTIDDAEDAEIRVAFEDVGNWSFLGPQALSVPRESATMNLGFLSGGDDDERLVLHEFGHVLGLGHEHLNPAGKLPWKKSEVLRFFQGPPNQWDEAAIKANLYTPWKASNYPAKKLFDPDSIMMYAFPSNLFRGGMSLHDNPTLSAMDKRFASALYPFD